jgi:DmsE family decaheme c-type cytochrome
VGKETCLECHEDFGQNIARTVHGRLSEFQYPGPARDCEACHGPGEAHAESNEPADIVVPYPDLGPKASEPCLECHQTGHLMNWKHSPHSATDVACVSCHQLHPERATPALLSQAAPDLCFTCHEDQKAQFYLPSHHPLKEGFMTCLSCHNPHSDSFAGVTITESARDLCLTCHMQYQGPFIFDHSPVEEGCELCHNPHGSVANNLLQQNEPFLCLQCHQPHFHAGLKGFEGSYSTQTGYPGNPNVDVWQDYEGYDGLSGISHVDAMKRVMLTKCTQCHQTIHGSDLPAQSIPGQGRALTR